MPYSKYSGRALPVRMFASLFLGSSPRLPEGLRLLIPDDAKVKTSSSTNAVAVSLYAGMGVLAAMLLAGVSVLPALQQILNPVTTATWALIALTSALLCVAGAAYSRIDPLAALRWEAIGSIGLIFTNLIYEACIIVVRGLVFNTAVTTQTFVLIVIVGCGVRLAQVGRERIRIMEREREIYAEVTRLNEEG